MTFDERRTVLVTFGDISHNMWEIIAFASLPNRYFGVFWQFCCWLHRESHLSTGIL
ncbi:hypothetical protein [Anabaena sp. CCY 0017]|uniref:hypothetical protein n=1 Tax=Anabaena sp. CCY 0017 TaxID=3103866 RepID=UPI0039C5F3A1